MTVVALHYLVWDGLSGSNRSPAQFGSGLSNSMLHGTWDFPRFLLILEEWNGWFMMSYASSGAASVLPHVNSYMKPGPNFSTHNSHSHQAFEWVVGFMENLVMLSNMQASVNLVSLSPDPSPFSSCLSGHSGNPHSSPPMKGAAAPLSTYSVTSIFKWIKDPAFSGTHCGDTARKFSLGACAS